MNTCDVIRLARKHVDNNVAMQSSARLCLADAIAMYDEGDIDSAKMWALRSLKYSTGIFNKDYQRASK